MPYPLSEEYPLAESPVLKQNGQLLDYLFLSLFLFFFFFFFNLTTKIPGGIGRNYPLTPELALHQVSLIVQLTSSANPVQIK